MRQNDITAGFPQFVADESFDFLRLWPLFILILLLHYHQGEVTTRDITGGVLPWAGNDHRDPIIMQCAVLDVCLIDEIDEAEVEIIIRFVDDRISPDYAPPFDDHSFTFIPDLPITGDHPLWPVDLNALKQHLDAAGLLDGGREELLPFLFCLGIFNLGPLNAGKDLRGIRAFTGTDPEKGASVLGRVVDELVIAESSSSASSKRSASAASILW